MSTGFDDATLAQVRAARPDMSTWLSANAGSGKTKVLTDRVALLLLKGAAPKGILCLTYTKAAAGEMQNRLFKQLGKWAMQDDAALRNQLGRLQETPLDDDQDLPKARRLFARAIETPGGLKIQTIHSFCASLLRRFPLEAGVSPGFQEADEAQIEEIQARVLDRLAVEDPEAFDAVFSLAGAYGIAGVASTVSSNRQAFDKLVSVEEMSTYLELNSALNQGALVAEPASVLSGVDQAALIGVLQQLGGNMEKLAGPLEAYLACPTDQTFESLAGKVLYSSGHAQAYQFKATWLTKAAREALESLDDVLDDFAHTVAETRPTLLKLRILENAQSLQTFAQAFLSRYAAEKAQLNVLDFDDLLLRTKALLDQPGVADWVLYRLDGDIEHVLVDEAQDTSPLQWQIIDLLTRELTAGEGQHAPGERTIFVVGDKKQSIYSFQGADPEGFDRMADDFATRLGRLDTPLQQAQLAHSFRSAPAILHCVDQTFGAEGLQGVPQDLSHIAFHGQMPGRVDLWPAIPKADSEPDHPWDDPVDLVSRQHHSVQLAEAIAAQISHMMAHENLWVRTENGYTARRINPGDFLILVQRRKDLFHEIIRACKAANLPLAGADRLKVGGELAVKDLTALMAFLATPEDSLSLAAALRSPLMGWSEDELFRLASPRKETHLWPALRSQQEDYPSTVNLLQGLLDRVDFLRPYELLTDILVRCDGRRNLIARLGPEAEEGIDALLSMALTFERSVTPSLTGFLAWLDADDSDLKRQPDTNADQIRVMTVHGAKGLEAPIVIVPDAGKRPETVRDQVLTNGPFPIWKPTKANVPEVLEDQLESAVASLREERARLLYVAMTRAEQWLILCAAGDVGEPHESWHGQVEQGLIRTGATSHRFELGDGMRLEHWPDAPQVVPASVEMKETSLRLPDVLHQPAAPPPKSDKVLSPSDLGGAKVIVGGGNEDGLALDKGTLLHRLLDIFPTAPPEDWDRVGLAEANRLAPDVPNPQMLIDKARALITDPELALLFAPDTLGEVPITGELGGQMAYGAIDRLIIRDAHITAVDFKSNVVIPSCAEETPIGILRQMAAYAALLGQVFPGQAIETAILWTETGTYMTLPHSLVSTGGFDPLHLDHPAPSS